LLIIKFLRKKKEKNSGKKEKRNILSLDQHPKIVALDT